MRDFSNLPIVFVDYFVGGLMSYLCCWCFAYFDVQHILCCVFAFFSSCTPCLVSFSGLSIFIAPSVFSSVYLLQCTVFYTDISCLGGVFAKNTSRETKQIPEPNGEGNLVSRLVFFANTPPKHDISV